MSSNFGLRRVLVLAVAAVSAIAIVPATASAKKPNKVDTSVMTRNVYLGADLSPVLGATTGAELITGAGVVWRQLQRTNFPGRAALLANEIQRLKPDAIGLQEVAHWQRDINGPPDAPITPANETVYDFLKLLRSELQARGLKYKVAVSQNEFSAELPVDNTQPPDFSPDFDAKLTMRDVTLVKSRLKTSGAKSLNYSPENTLLVPIPGSPIPLAALRGWTKIDIKKQGIKYRFVNTHLEAFDEDVRLGQAHELANRDELNFPRIVLVGDLNSDPDGDSPEAYNAFTTGDAESEGGFADRGVDVNTCCHNAEVTNPPPAAFDSRIDHVLSRGKVKGLSATLVGAETDVFNQLGIWPSDHGGVFAKVRVRR